MRNNLEIRIGKPLLFQMFFLFQQIFENKIVSLHHKTISYDKKDDVISN